MPTALQDFDAYPKLDSAVAPRAVYVHVPFCLHRCGYCDFTLVAQHDDLIPAWLASLQSELSRIDRRYEVDTVFVGGGTPTHLSVPQLRRLFDLIETKFQRTHAAEVSIEANPDGLDTDRLNTLRDLGVNRLSLGVQSFDDNVLATLERQHTSSEAIDIVDRASERFENVSLDLIFGVPGQTPKSWQDTLNTAVSLPLNHVSTYGLTFEKGTEFFRRLTHGSLVATPDTTERDMYETAMNTLNAAGLQQYEISNFARPGYECRHNHVYWDAAEYFAFGPGAARYVSGTRSTNARSVVRWINSWANHIPVFQESEHLSPEEKAREAIFLGLRRIQGIDLAAFQTRFGIDARSIEPQHLQNHMTTGLLEIVDGALRLTNEGRFLADTVVGDFV
ncbi:MAG: radical SAM family heme chaperone HemW [Planctomycetaceae bacterium]